MTTGDSPLRGVTECIKGVVLANYTDKEDRDQRISAGEKLGVVRAEIVIIRGLLTVGWNMRFISHGAFMNLTVKLDEIEKQMTRWQAPCPCVFLAPFCFSWCFIAAADQ